MSSNEAEDCNAGDTIANPFMMLVDPAAYRKQVADSAALASMPGRVYVPVDLPPGEGPHRLFDVSVRSCDGSVQRMNSRHA